MACVRAGPERGRGLRRRCRPAAAGHGDDVADGHGKRHVQDGPYADSKEQLGGYYIIDVPSLDAALDWAARVPAAPGSVLEVRPNLQVPG